MSHPHSSSSTPSKQNPTQQSTTAVEAAEDPNSIQAKEATIPKLRGMFHLLGAIACIPASYYLLMHVHQTHPTGDHWYFSATMMYMLSLLLLMTSSAIYHVPKWPAATKALLRRVDHAMIYVLIAGSLIPFIAVLDAQCPLYVIILLIANTIFGVVRSLFMNIQQRALRVISYLVMGAIPVLLLPKMYDSLGHVILTWVIVGGIFYGVGALIYTLKRPNPFPKVLGFHEIFHIFVNIAATCHFIAVWKTFNII